jgi:hypothetical protein
MTRLEATLAQIEAIAAVNRFRDQIGWKRTDEKREAGNAQRS